jgi:predicted amidophosphoribosyltransferase
LLEQFLTFPAYRVGMPFNDPTRCPSCGERVTPYAAGCAICGAELDPTRWHRPPSLMRRLLSWHRRPPSGGGASDAESRSRVRV